MSSRAMKRTLPKQSQGMPQYFPGHKTPSVDFPLHALLICLGVFMDFHVKSCYEEDVYPSNYEVCLSIFLVIIPLQLISLSMLCWYVWEFSWVFMSSHAMKRTSTQAITRYASVLSRS